MSNWFKKQITNIAIAMANVEKNVFSQEGLDLASNTSMTQTKNQHSVINSLIRGEITEEVEKLRWRMYNTLSHTRQITHKIKGYDSEGYPIMKSFLIGDEIRLKSIKTDETDGGELIMVVDNAPISLSGFESIINNGNINPETYSGDTVDINNTIVTNLLNNEVNVDELDYTDKHGISSNIELDDLTSMSVVTILENLKIDSTKETIHPITVSRESRPKFEIEKFTKKLHIKKYNDKFLLEFFVSKYPEEYNPTSKFFISHIKKLKETPRRDSMLEMEGIHFVTDKTVGVPDFLEFEYKIINFHNIVEFNGYLIIKFIGDVVKNGDSIIEKYRNIELDEKYKNKENR
jgi:hypothetical protein